MTILFYISITFCVSESRVYVWFFCLVVNVYIQRSRSKQKGKESSSGGGPTVEEMEEKEERLRHLEEVNMSLKQTNDDLNEEVAELKRQIGDFQAKVCAI